MLSSYQVYDRQQPQEEAIKTRVKIFTTNNVEIRGEIVVEGQGWHSRLSDALNDPRPFIPVINAHIYVSNQLKMKSGFICLNKQLIAFAVEE